MSAYELKECLLKAEGVYLTLGGNLILRDVNLEVRNITRATQHQGQVVGLLGPSGVGKTRLFRILAGLDLPDSGTVIIGHPPKPVKRGAVGVVAQHYPLFEHRTVLSNLIVAGTLGGLSKSEAADRGRQFIERFNLTGSEGKYPVQLSGGMRQRAAIAQQFMCSEHFLLMDEPFSGLDVNAIDRVVKFIHEVASADDLNTLIVVTHDIEAAVEVCDTIWMLGRDRHEDGSVIPGAYIKHSINLIDRGLAWQPDVAKIPAFRSTVMELRDLFANL